MLHVVDIASYQWDLVKKSSELITGADCVVVKISEGISYRNPYAFDMLRSAKAHKQGIGVYHYCHAETNSPLLEANHFINTIRSLEIERGCVLALDYEEAAFQNKNMGNWAREFLDYVFAETGVRPMLYVQQNMIKNFEPVLLGNYGLWIAQWDVMKPGSIAPWKFYAMWQYHVQKTKAFGLDMNLFNGDMKAWKKYGGL